ncbi:MAG: hypothetical protein LBT00_00365 [Spirochaetaceae bacterium]|nr:hypothetical protein [Spirochaetaceae bacterium]
MTSPSRHCTSTCHCEPSEAIQQGTPRLDCFTLRVRNDAPLPSLRLHSSLRAKRSNPAGTPRLDCFTLRVRNDEPLPSLRLHSSLRAERSNPVWKGLPRLDCFTNGKLPRQLCCRRFAMTVPLSLRLHSSLRASGTLPSGAIQRGMPRLDCFTLRVRNDTPSRHCASTRHCERSEAIRREGLPRLDCFTNGKLPRQLCCRRFAMTRPPVIAPSLVIASERQIAERSNPVRNPLVWIASPCSLRNDDPAGKAVTVLSQTPRLQIVIGCQYDVMLFQPFPCSGIAKHLYFYGSWRCQ